jgi:hypothetical protein
MDSQSSKHGGHQVANRDGASTTLGLLLQDRGDHLRFVATRIIGQLRDGGMQVFHNAIERRLMFVMKMA